MYHDNVLFGANEAKGVSMSPDFYYPVGLNITILPETSNHITHPRYINIEEMK